MTRSAVANGKHKRGIIDLLDFEAQLVGAVLVDPSAFDDVAGTITVADFEDPDHAALWELMPALRARGFKPSDISVLCEELQNVGRWGPNRIDAARLGQMFDAIPTNAQYYAAKVREAAKRRRVASMAELAALAEDPSIDVDSILLQLQESIDLSNRERFGSILGIGSLIESSQDHRPALIDGALRLGETANLIASPKVGKSWLAIQLAYAVATGGEWLGHRTHQGKVLMIDNELHPETLSMRLRCVASASQLDLVELAGRLDVLPVRGRNLDINGVPRLLCGIRPGRYQLIILDALYRFLPKGTSENDNAAMMQVYNALDALAAMTGAAIVIVHHSSKGDQSGKAQTDVGSGAGSISRAPDCHITIRPHEDAGLFVLESVARSWPPSEPISIRWEYPLWSLSAVEAKLANPKTAADRRQESTDKETRDRLLSELQDRWLSVGELRGRTAFSEGRVIRGLSQLKLSGAVESKTVRRKKSKRKAEVWHAA